MDFGDLRESVIHACHKWGYSPCFLEEFRETTGHEMTDEELLNGIVYALGYVNMGNGLSNTLENLSILEDLPEDEVKAIEEYDRKSE